MPLSIKKFYTKRKFIVDRLVKKPENKGYIFNYQLGDKIFSIYTLFWILSVVKKYTERDLLPHDLFKPIVWFQEIFIDEFPSSYYFYFIVLIGFTSVGLKLVYPSKIIFRLLTFIAVLWLNAFAWSYGSFSHSGHLLVLAHFFSIFLVYDRKYDENDFSYQVRLFHLGMLITYTFAGFWKYIGFFKEVWISKSLEYTWMGADSIKINAINNMLAKEVVLDGWMLNMYDAPIIWQVLTILIFTIQLLALFGAFRQKWSYFLVAGLILFHVYNVIFIETYFYPAIMTLLIFFFPYHLLLKKRFNKLTFKKS